MHVGGGSLLIHLCTLVWFCLIAPAQYTRFLPCLFHASTFLISTDTQLHIITYYLFMFKNTLISFTFFLCLCLTFSSTQSSAYILPGQKFKDSFLVFFNEFQDTKSKYQKKQTNSLFLMFFFYRQAFLGATTPIQLDKLIH